MKDWRIVLLKNVFLLIVVIVGFLLGITAVITFNNERTKDNAPSERIRTEIIDDGKYLLIYKTIPDGRTIYTSQIVDKGDREK